MDSATCMSVRRSAEGHFRLEHPEFRRMPGRIAILGPEGGAKRIDIFEGQGKGFGFQLPAHRQVGLAGEKVPAIVHPSVGSQGQLLGLQHRHLEGLTGAFGIAGGYYRGVHIDKSLVLEKAVDCIGKQGAHSEYGCEKVGPGAQMGHFAQEFTGMAFGLNGIILG